MTLFRNMGKNPIIKDIIFQEKNNVNRETSTVKVTSK